MRYITGIQPSGKLTLGNYIGSIKQCLELQDDLFINENFIFIADMHSITVNQDPSELKHNINSLIKLYLACGLNPHENIFFLQSDNVYHTNLSWVFECLLKHGQLNRMTQFKDKSSKNESFSVGLFTYPALMAADILLYDVDAVPIGLDQKQHLELTRDIAVDFNKKYGNTFTIPEPHIASTGFRIMDLQNPTVKMSKSATNQKGVVYLLDNPKEAYTKIMKAVTDSEDKVYYNPETKPGISNLMSIYSALTNLTYAEIESKYAKDLTYKRFKEDVAEEVMYLLTCIQNTYNSIRDDKINEILDYGKYKTTKIAKQKWEEIRKKVGIFRA